MNRKDQSKSFNRDRLKLNNTENNLQELLTNLKWNKMYRRGIV